MSARASSAIHRLVIAATIAGGVAVAGAAGASASPAPVPPGGADSSGSLIPVPPGCVAPESADVAFIGTAVAKDFEKVRFELDHLRAGSASGFAIDGLIDVLYLDDAKFLDVGEEYLVGARFDPEYGQLASRVRPPEPLFGGNDVIGLEDSDVECPELDDPVRTLLPDGSSVDSGVLTPLFEDKRTLLATLGVPSAIAFAVLIGLVLLRSFWGAAVRGIFELGRSAVTPTPDHTAVRVRSHRRRPERLPDGD